MSTLFYAITEITNFTLFSPLEQFDEVNWFFNRVYESTDNKNNLSIYLWEREFYSVDRYFNTYTQIKSFFSQDNGFFVALITFILISRFFFDFSSDFSGITLLAVIHLFTGTLFSFWFSDYFFSSRIVNPTALDSMDSIEYARTFLPQINLTFAIDERRITFFLGFFLIGGGESEDDEDFFLSEESDFELVQEIVAPVFVANLGKDIKENAALYLKVCAIFSFVLISNLRGRIPYGDTATSSLILTFWVALSVFSSLITLRIRKHGVNYFFSLFRPSGCPRAIIPLLIPIEFLSYSFRVVSLSVRLFANRRAGHTLRKVLIGFSYVRFTLGEGYAVAAFLPALVVFILIFLERAVAGIQAYIFTILICIYLKDLYVSH